MSPTARDVDSAKSIESAALAALLTSAGALRDAAIARGQHPPRSVLENARTMARHLGMPDHRMHDLVPSMGLWQAYLPSALGRDTAILTQVRSRLPYSYGLVRSAFPGMESHGQAVFLMFHMAALPLVGALLATACIETHSHAGHVLVRPGNVARLHAQSGRWAVDACEVISTDPPGLRRVISGLRLGTITRLLVLPDGPYPAGRAGTRTLTNISSTLAFKTGLLARILAMGIPIRPLTHAWESGSLVLNWHPFLNNKLNRAGKDSPEQAISDVAALLEDMLRRHPEQWLNWKAAGLRK
jgi:hypothetical protein